MIADKLGIKDGDLAKGEGNLVIDEMKIAKDFAAEFAIDKKKEYENFNLMILGKSGTGKSTLINNLFGDELVEAGVGKPVTQEIKRIEKEGYPLVIYDTPGLELGGKNSTDNLLESVKDVIKQGIDSGNVGDAIHVILYCVSVTSHRIENTEIEFIRKLTEDKLYDVPVIIVLTQAFNKEDTLTIKGVIEKENLNIRNIVPILAEDYEIDEEYVAKAKGLDVLADVIYQVIPDSMEDTFAKIEKANAELKRKKAQLIVTGAATTAMGIGVTPVPFADALLLAPTEAVMIAGITALYELPYEEKYLTKLASGLIAAGLGTVLGKSVVTGIMKLVPGAGSVAGGVVSGLTAAVITTAIGNAYIEIMDKVFEGDISLEYLESDKGKKEFVKLVKKQMKIRKKGDEIIATSTN